MAAGAARDAGSTAVEFGALREPSFQRPAPARCGGAGSAPPLRARASVRAALVLATVVAVALAAYWNTFEVPFQFDDQENIVDNPAVHAVELDVQSMERAAGGFPLRRWLAMVSFALNHVAGGLAPAGYHAVNLAFHVGSALLVWLLSLEILRHAAPLAEASRRRVAALAALFFVAHPVHTQAVTYVVQRMTSMGAAFAFLALWCHLRARRPGARHPGLLFACAGAAAFLALSCKENFAVLPLLAAIVEVVLLPGWRERLRARRKAAWCAAAAFGALAAAAVARYWNLILSEHARFGLPIGERLLTQPRVVLHYLSLLAWPLPSRLHVEDGIAASQGLLDPPGTLAALLGLAALVGAAVAVRRRAPLATFAVAWFLGALAIEQSILPIDLAFEHRLYFPSFGPLLLAAYGIERLAARLAIPAWLLGAAPVAALVLATSQRNETWNDPVRLYADAAEHASAGSPGLRRALITLGTECRRRGDLDRAEAALRQAVALEPENDLAWLDLGYVALDRRDLAGAERLFRQALAVNGLSKRAWYNLGWVLVEEQRLDEAERAYRTALSIDPSLARARVNLAVMYSRAGDLSRAAAELTEAIRSDPGLAIAYQNRARVFLAQGRPAEALEDARAQVALDGRSPEAHALVAECLGALGRSEDARHEMEEAQRLAGVSGRR